MLHQPQDIIAERYRILSTLGQGAFATTYEAEDINNSQQVAIKVLSLRDAQDWKVLELFEREVKVLKQISHPSIPKYLDYVQVEHTSDRRFYLVQELIKGQSLAELVKNGWQPSEDAVKQIGMQILKLLEYLHSMNPPIIHRDIQPKNIIRRSDSEVFLVDFGAVQDIYRNTLTRGGTFVGTLGYMPREQFRGHVKPASDLYSLGATLLFLLIGRSPAELPLHRLKIDFRSSVSISDHFADWLETMLEPAIEDRFQSATDARIDLLSVFNKVDRELSLMTQPSISPKIPPKFCPMIPQSPSPYIVWTKTENPDQVIVNIYHKKSQLEEFVQNQLKKIYKKLEKLTVQNNFMEQIKKLRKISLDNTIIIGFAYILVVIFVILTGYWTVSGGTIFSWVVMLVFLLSLLRNAIILLEDDEKKLHYVSFKVNSNTTTIQVIQAGQVNKELKFDTADIDLIDFKIYYQKNHKNGKSNNLIVWEGVRPYEVTVSRFFTKTELQWLSTQLCHLFGIKYK